MYSIRELLLFYLYSKHHEYILAELQTVEKQLLKESNSVQMIDGRAAKPSDFSYPIYKKFKLDSFNWIPT